MSEAIDTSFFSEKARKDLLSLLQSVSTCREVKSDMTFYILSKQC